MADEETASGGGLISGPFRSDRLVFDVLTNCVADRAIVESFFHDLKISDESPNARYRLTREQDSGPDAAVLVEGPRVDPFSTHDLADALTRLVAGLSIATLDASPSNLHLHAAAAAKGGRSVIIAASRNTGKSTSVSHLLHRGYGFITDEMVVLSRKDDLVRGVPRPISIKPMGLPQTGYSGAQTMLGETEDPTSQCFVTPGSIGTEIIEAEAPHVVVLLRRPGGERAQGPRPLHPADAVVALMQETLDADRFGPDTALRLAQLASRCHCIELERGTPTEVADAIDGLLSLAPPVGMVVRAYPPQSGIRRRRRDGRPRGSLRRPSSSEWQDPGSGRGRYASVGDGRRVEGAPRGAARWSRHRLVRRPTPIAWPLEIGGRPVSYPDDFVPALASDFLRHNVDGEAVVWSPWRSVPTALDAVETVMLEVVDGEATVAELSRDVHEEVGIPLETAEAQVRRTIATFDRAGLLTSSSRGQAAVEAIANRRMFVNPVSY